MYRNVKGGLCMGEGQYKITNGSQDCGNTIGMWSRFTKSKPCKCLWDKRPVVVPHESEWTKRCVGIVAVSLKEGCYRE